MGVCARDTPNALQGDCRGANGLRLQSQAGWEVTITQTTANSQPWQLPQSYQSEPEAGRRQTKRQRVSDAQDNTPILVFQKEASSMAQGSGGATTTARLGSLPPRTTFTTCKICILILLHTSVGSEQWGQLSRVTQHVN